MLIKEKLMKRLLIIIILVSSPLLQAEQTRSNSSSSQSSKLKAIQHKIDKYTKTVNEMPARLRQKIKNFDRLQGIGVKVNQVVKKYLVALDSCANKIHSTIGREACEEFDNLNIGEEIRKEKQKVVNAIAEAERELKNVRDMDKDIPLFKNLIDTLQSTKNILMYGK